MVARGGGGRFASKPVPLETAAVCVFFSFFFFLFARNDPLKTRSREGWGTLRRERLVRPVGRRAALLLLVVEVGERGVDGFDLFATWMWYANSNKVPGMI